MSDWTSGFSLAGDSPFRFACRRCSRCCHHQRIMLTPYEVLRLARNRGTSTGQAIALYTSEAGTVLRFDGPGDGCVFLTPEGCAIHPDRPLACRLYPLGRFVAQGGRPSYRLLPGHPQCEGTLDTSGGLPPGETIDAYVAGQGVDPFFRAGDRYYALFLRLYHMLGAASVVDGQPGEAAWAEEDAAGWADIDAITDAYCAENGVLKPTDIEALVEIHIEAVSRWADSLVLASRR